MSGSDELDVSMNGMPIGTLARTRRGARFSYRDDVIAGYAGQPLLSAALPVKARAYAEGLTGAWFRGLLPEGERLERLCRKFGVLSTDYVGILAEVGWECAGAVAVAPSDFVASAPTAPKSLSDEELGGLLDALPSFETDGDVVRVSLGGYQDKLCIAAEHIACEGSRVVEACFALPTAAGISTHILKPQPPNRYPQLIAAEAWAMTAASRAARCANVVLLDLEGAPLTLCVERFDRVRVGGDVRRVHQEDCCQALGLDPRRKYANEREAKGDDPTYCKIAGILARYSLDPTEEAAELLRQMTVNLALGNTDAHAKNYALLYEHACVPMLSPLYDVVPVMQVEPRAELLSVRINGKLRTKDVRFEDLVAEADSWGIAGLDAQTIVRTALADLLDGIEHADALYPEAGKLFSKTARLRADELLP